MDDLISRKALDDAFAELRWNEDGTLNHFGDRPDWCMHGSEVDKLIQNAPSVPAVPLDRLCEWLETDCILSCVSCEHLFGGQWCKQHPELPYRCHRKEHWKDVLTKWMEEQDAQKEN